MADVVEQANLVEIKGRRPIKMGDAFIRPALDGKRLPGEVEIHQNGIRYQSMGPQKVGMCPFQNYFVLEIENFSDVLFSNIKHLFFQPCDHELLVIVHLHLKAPIIIGKKKTFVHTVIQISCFSSSFSILGSSIFPGSYGCSI